MQLWLPLFWRQCGSTLIPPDTAARSAPFWHKFGTRSSSMVGLQPATMYRGYCCSVSASARCVALFHTGLFACSVDVVDHVASQEAVAPKPPADAETEPFDEVPQDG
jgi:hypothetical protein